MVTVYGKPACTGCRATKRMLDKLGVVYEEVDLTQDEVALARFQAKGLVTAPIVETDTDTWSGFRYDKLKELV